MNFGYFYHITQKFWPKEICLIPQEYGEYRSYDEPTIARTCVSNTIAGCLCSIGWLLKFEKPVFIYRTKFKVLTENPYNVYDSYITGEKWLLKPTSFVLVGKLNWGFYPLKIKDIDHIAANELLLSLQQIFKYYLQTIEDKLIIKI